jgi:hypothetical protein
LDHDGLGIKMGFSLLAERLTCSLNKIIEWRSKAGMSDILPKGEDHPVSLTPLRAQHPLQRIAPAGR